MVESLLVNLSFKDFKIKWFQSWDKVYLASEIRFIGLGPIVFFLLSRLYFLIIIYVKY